MKNVIKSIYHYRLYVIYRHNKKLIKALYHKLLYKYYKRKEPF